MRKRLSWIAIGVVILGIGYYSWFLFSGRSLKYGGDSTYYSMPDDNDTLFGDIFKTSHFNDSLPHYMYKKFTDSLQNAKMKDGYVTSAAGLFGSFGYVKEAILPTILANENWKKDPKYKVIEDTLTNIYSDSNYLKDTAAYLQRIQSLKNIQDRILMEQYDIQYANKDQPSKYYFVVNDYKFKNPMSQFFTKNGKNYIAYPVIDKQVKSKEGGIISNAHFEREATHYKFVATNTLMFPISKSFYDVLIVGFWIISFLLLIVVTYVFLGFPIGILVNISKGRAFIDQNIHYLKTLLKWAIAFTVLKTLMPFFLYLIFYKSIATHFELANWGSFISQIFWSYVFCFVIFLIKKAFEKGYEMQKNEDLTV